MKKILFYLKVKSSSGQWRTIVSANLEEHEQQKQGFMSFDWKIIEEYTRVVYDKSNQLKLEL